MTYPYKCCWCEKGFWSRSVRDAHERSCDVPAAKKARKKKEGK